MSDAQDDVKKINMTDEELVEENENSGDFDQQTFEAVKGLVLNLSVKLDEAKEKQKEYRERLKNMMDNDESLAEFEQQAKNAADAFRKRKKELNESTEGKEIKAKIREFSEEIKDLEESLTNNLLSYYQMTGVQSFELPTGEEREFKLKARLLPTKKS